MTRAFLHIPLERLEPGPERYSPRRPGILVAPITGTATFGNGGYWRYRVIGGHDLYWRAIAEGEREVFCEVITR